MTNAMWTRPLGFNWLLPMQTVRAVGGYDSAYMTGLCYEDDDFVIQMWRHGCDIVFCDDVLGLHMEHKRDHLTDLDGRVKVNTALFVSRYGRADYLKRIMFKIHAYTAADSPGLSAWFHEENDERFARLAVAQRMYGHDAPWRAGV
jgi:hypothetical protein